MLECPLSHRSNRRRRFPRDGGYEVDVAGRRVPVTVSLRPPFDPDGVRLGRGPA